MQEKHTGTSYQHISATASTWRLQCGVIAMALAILIATPAQAGQWSLLINGKAVHLDEQPGIEYNEENWGGGVQYDFDMTPGKWVPFVNASVFDDSNKNLSYYAGGGTVRRFALGKEEGALHLDAGVVSFGTQRVALNVTYIPKVDPKMVPIVFFQLKIGLH
jgi:hypothetical protein